MTSSEFSFIEKCKDLKYFVSSEYELPTNKTDALLYNWFSKTRKKLTQKSLDCSFYYLFLQYRMQNREQRGNSARAIR